jgi:hypothetical protein
MAAMVVGAIDKDAAHAHVAQLAEGDFLGSRCEHYDAVFQSTFGIGDDLAAARVIARALMSSFQNAAFHLDVALAMRWDSHVAAHFPQLIALKKFRAIFVLRARPIAKAHENSGQDRHRAEQSRQPAIGCRSAIERKRGIGRESDRRPALRGCGIHHISPRGASRGRMERWWPWSAGKTQATYCACRQDKTLGPKLRITTA